MTNMVESKLTDVAMVCVSTIKSRILLQLKIKHAFDHVRKTKAQHEKLAVTGNQAQGLWLEAVL